MTEIERLTKTLANIEHTKQFYQKEKEKEVKAIQDEWNEYKQQQQKEQMINEDVASHFQRSLQQILSLKDNIVKLEKRIEMHKQREKDFEIEGKVHERELKALQDKVQEEIKKRFMQQLGGLGAAESKSKSTLDSKEDQNQEDDENDESENEDHESIKQESEAEYQFSNKDYQEMSNEEQEEHYRKVALGQEAADEVVGLIIEKAVTPDKEGEEEFE